jgi:hypothetical protein
MCLLADVMPIGMSGKRLLSVRIPYDEETTVAQLTALAQKMIDKFKQVIGSQEILTVRGEDGSDYFDDIAIVLALQMSNKLIFMAVAIDQVLKTEQYDTSCSSAV